MRSLNLLRCCRGPEAAPREMLESITITTKPGRLRPRPSLQATGTHRAEAHARAREPGALLRQTRHVTRGAGPSSLHQAIPPIPRINLSEKLVKDRGQRQEEHRCTQEQTRL